MCRDYQEGIFNRLSRRPEIRAS